MRAILLATFTALAVAGPLAAQPTPPRTLADVQRAFEAQRRAAAMQVSENPMQQFREMIAAQAAELEAFVNIEARGDDRFNGRLALVDLYLLLADTGKAREVLLALNAEESPPLILLVAADLAARIGLNDKRGQWIEAALAKDSALEERMEMARVLMTLLVEVDRGQQIFNAALADADNDEDRAKVLWYQSVAVREREDLEEDAYHDALEALAKTYPSTFYGSIAADRVRAAELRVGEAAIPFSTVDRQGNPVSLEGYKGKVLLLQFWASWDPISRQLVNPALAELYGEHQDQGFEILGISLDDDPAQLTRALAEDKMTWPQVFDGKVWQTELALRYVVEGIPYLMLIGRDGKIAGMNLFPDTPEGIRELKDLVAGTVAKK